MNDTTFQGSGNVAYVPVIVNDKLKRTNADRIRSMTDEELAEFLEAHCFQYGWLDWLKEDVSN